MVKNMGHHGRAGGGLIGKHLGAGCRSVVPKLLTNLRPVHVNSMIPSINLIIKFVACVFVYLTVGMFFTGFSGQKSLV